MLQLKSEAERSESWEENCFLERTTWDSMCEAMASDRKTDRNRQLRLDRIQDSFMLLQRACRQVHLTEGQNWASSFSIAVIHRTDPYFRAKKLI